MATLHTTRQENVLSMSTVMSAGVGAAGEGAGRVGTLYVVKNDWHVALQDSPPEISYRQAFKSILGVTSVKILR